MYLHFFIYASAGKAELLLNIFVETIIFFQVYLMNRKFRRLHLFIKCKYFL